MIEKFTQFSYISISGLLFPWYCPTLFSLMFSLLLKDLCFIFFILTLPTFLMRRLFEIAPLNIYAVCNSCTVLEFDETIRCSLLNSASYFKVFIPNCF